MIHPLPDPIKALTRDLVAAVDAFASGALPMEDHIAEVLRKPEHRDAILKLIDDQRGAEEKTP